MRMPYWIILISLFVITACGSPMSLKEAKVVADEELGKFCSMEKINKTSFLPPEVQGVEELNDNAGKTARFTFPVWAFHYQTTMTTPKHFVTIIINNHGMVEVSHLSE